MAIRQYIGARYVPKFMGTYDPTQIYEALDVVDNGLGTSYISKVPTPAGTPLTDTTHWAIYGASSGAIINLQNQINANSADIQSLNNEIDDIVNEVRRVVVVGDSYMLHGTKPWHLVMKELLDVANDDFFAYGEGGAGFVHVGNGGHTFETLLSANISNITDKDSITDIFIGGGTNDFYYFTIASDLRTAINSMVTYCKGQFTNARIWIVFNGYVTNMSDLMFTHYQLVKYIYCTQLSHKVRGIMANLPMLIGGNREDSQHPNDTGSLIMGRIIYNALFASVTPIFGEQTQTISQPSTGDTLAGSHSIKLTLLGNSMSLIINDFTLSGTAIRIRRNNPIEIGTYSIDDLQVIPDDYNDYIGTIYALNGSATEAIRVRFSFTLSGSTVTISAIPIIDAGIDYNTTSITALANRFFLSTDLI